MENFSSAAGTIPNSPRPWGFFATLGWGLPIIAAAAVIQQRVYWKTYAAVFFSTTAQLLPWTWALTASSLTMTMLTLAVIKLRRGCAITAYLALRKAPWRKALVWAALGVVATSLASLIRFVLDERPDNGLATLSQDHVLWYWMAFVVLVPVSEEAFFRGFLLTGMSGTRFRDAVGIPLAAAIWAVLHGEATWRGFTALFLFGCLLGLMRRACHSIVPGICVHSVNNVLAEVIGLMT